MTAAQTEAQTGPSVVSTAGDESIGLPALLSEVTALLTKAGLPSPRVDAETLAATVLDLPRGVLAARAALNDPVEARDAGRIRALAQARAARVPVQHLTGQAWFRTVTVRVGAGVFVPRPETEVVAGAAIDEASRLARAGRQPLVVDLGTGSGVIAAAVAAEVPAARVHAVERAPKALAWAQVNLAGTPVQLHAADLATALEDLNGLVDVVVSNPPYIPDGSVPRDPEVRDYDPPEALYGGGADGLAMMRVVIATAGRLLQSGGLLVVEHGEIQGAAVRALLGAPGWELVATAPDLTGRPRYTTARRGAGLSTWGRRDVPGDQRDRGWRS